MNETFEINGNLYKTNIEGLELIKSLMPSAKAKNDYTAVHAFLICGEILGKVIKAA